MWFCLFCDSELDVVTNAWDFDKRHICWADLTLDDEQRCFSQVIHITDIPVMQVMDEVAKQRVPERRTEQDVDIHVSKKKGGEYGYSSRTRS